MTENRLNEIELGLIRGSLMAKQTEYFELIRLARMGLVAERLIGVMGSQPYTDCIYGLAELSKQKRPPDNG